MENHVLHGNANSGKTEALEHYRMVLLQVLIHSYLPVPLEVRQYWIVSLLSSEDLCLVTVSPTLFAICERTTFANGAVLLPMFAFCVSLDHNSNTQSGTPT